MASARSKTIRCADGKRRTPRRILERVKQRITECPETYNQGFPGWGPPSCGSPACIAGHALFIMDGNLRRSFEDLHAKLTGSPLVPEQWPWLFEATWSNPRKHTALWKSYQEAGTDDAKRAAIACRAIDLYMEEYGL